MSEHMEQSLRTDTWHHCYDDRLQQLIVPEAFSHPAKMAWGLAQRIMGHLGIHWPDARDGVLLDPMAGIGTVGLAGAYAGYRTILGELEGHFATLCAENIALHADRLRALGKPVPLLFRHDAQALPLGSAGCVVSSPPFASSLDTGSRAWIATQMLAGKMRTTATGKNIGVSGHSGRVQDYGSHPAQLGNLRAVVSSPPYGAIRQDGAGIQREDGAPSFGSYDEGVTDTWHTQRDQTNLGNKHGGYWEAMYRVYRECARVLPPCAPIILVVKGYIKNKQYVDLPSQTAQLLEDCGFTVVHWHEASLVSRESQLGLFGGETRKSRKSFFRRLAERHGAPPIDAEIVLCAERT